MIKLANAAPIVHENTLGTFRMQWRYLQRLQTECNTGNGLAVCPELGLLAVTNARKNTVDVFELPLCSQQSMRLLKSLGGQGRLKFNFALGGDVAFLRHAGQNLLAVADEGRDAIHLVDVVTGTHKGYIAHVGAIRCPDRMTVFDDKHLAVTTIHGKCMFVFGHHSRKWVCIPNTWEFKYMYDPFAAKMHRATSGSNMCDFDSTGQVAVPCEQGWIAGTGAGANAVAVAPHLRVLNRARQQVATIPVPWTSRQRVKSLAVVPGKWIFARVMSEWCQDTRLHVFADPHAISMEVFSAVRLAWMSAVVRLY